MFFALLDLRCISRGELGYTCGKTKVSEDGIQFRFTDEQKENPGFSSDTSGKEPTCQCRRRKETQVQSLGGGDPLEDGMATHSSILAWRIPWTEEPGRLQPLGLQSGTQLEQLSMHARGRIWDPNLNEKRMRNRRKKPCCLMETWLFSGFLSQQCWSSWTSKTALGGPAPALRLLRSVAGLWPLDGSSISPDSLGDGEPVSKVLSTIFFSSQIFHLSVSQTKGRAIVFPSLLKVYGFL